MNAKTTEPTMLFAPKEQQVALADIYAFILRRRKARQDQAKNNSEETETEEDGNTSE
jgi:hypothetical protein